MALNFEIEVILYVLWLRHAQPTITVANTEPAKRSLSLYDVHWACMTFTELVEVNTDSFPSRHPDHSSFVTSTKAERSPSSCPCLPFEQTLFLPKWEQKIPDYIVSIKNNGFEFWNRSNTLCTMASTRSANNYCSKHWTSQTFTELEKWYIP